MPTAGAGAIGSMNVPPDERRKLATRYATSLDYLLLVLYSSVNFVCDDCGPTKDLVLPLTSASTSTVKEALEVASQFTLTVRFLFPFSPSIRLA